MTNNTKIFSITKKIKKLEKTLVLSIICSKCKNEEKKIFKYLKKSQLKY